MSQPQRLPRFTLEPAGTGEPSTLPIVLLVHGYALFGALVTSRAVLKAVEISDRYWVGRQIFRTTEPFARILQLFPGANSRYIGEMTLADLTLVTGVVLFPLGMLAFGGRRR